MIELHLERAVVGADRNRLIQPSVLDPQIVEHPKRLAGKPSQLVVVAFALQLPDDHQGQHHLVLRETRDGPRIREQNRGVEYVGAN